MRELPVRVFNVSLLLVVAMLAGELAAAQEKTATEQNPALQIKTIRTMQQADFLESLRDKLSGGMSQHLPFRMATDSQGRILITEPFGSRVQVLDTKAGKRWQIRGDKKQRMVFPTYIAVDTDDNIYVSEPILAVVAVFRPDGHFLRAIGGEHLVLPFGLALDQASRKLYVADHFRSEIQVYSLEGQLLQVISSLGVTPGMLRQPCDLALHHGMLFVLDTGNQRFQIFDLQGNSKGVTPFGNDRWPVAFAFDAAGNLYYVDMASLGVQVENPSGSSIASLDVQLSYGQPRNELMFPSFTSVVQGPNGSVLALRPALKVEEVRLAPGGEAGVGVKPNQEQSQ